MKLLNQVGKFLVTSSSMNNHNNILLNFLTLFYIIFHTFQTRTSNKKLRMSNVIFFFCNFKGVTFKKDEKEENNTKKLQKC